MSNAASCNSLQGIMELSVIDISLKILFYLYLTYVIIIYHPFALYSFGEMFRMQLLQALTFSQDVMVNWSAACSLQWRTYGCT